MFGVRIGRVVVGLACGMGIVPTAALGASWAVQHSPNPARANVSWLSGVFCTSARACTAVGSSGRSFGSRATLVEVWSGKRWVIVRTPNPTGAKNSTLSAVFCASPSACTAVGNYTNGAGTELTLAERWNGRTWSIQPTPNPAGALSEISLAGVSCPSPTSCTAVGAQSNTITTAIGAGKQATLAESWNGTTWTIDRTPNPTRGSLPQSWLLAVSCPSPTVCSAVGGSGSIGTLAERWQGTNWAISPTGSSGAGDLRGVSCFSSMDCTAVGESDTAPLAERWNGNRWMVQHVPNPGGGLVTPEAVACASTNACTAVGGISSGVFTSLVAAWRWDRMRWTLEQAGNLPGALPQGALYAVSCLKTTSCVAVGERSTSDVFGRAHQATLVERGA